MELSSGYSVRSLPTSRPLREFAGHIYGHKTDISRGVEKHLVPGSRAMQVDDESVSFPRLRHVILTSNKAGLLSGILESGCIGPREVRSWWGPDRGQ